VKLVKKESFFLLVFYLLRGKRNTKAWCRFKKSQYGKEKKGIKNNGALSDLPKSFF